MTDDKTSLTIVRRIKAPPAKVYSAWTRPDVLARWWGPDGGPVLRAELDPRVGGRFRIVFQSLDGTVNDCSGEYREVETDHSLVFTWQWATTPERQSLVSVQLRPVPEGTELTFTHARFFDQAARDRHQVGWNMLLDKLDDLFEEVRQ